MSSTFWDRPYSVTASSANPLRLPDLTTGRKTWGTCDGVVICHSRDRSTDILCIKSNITYTVSLSLYIYIITETLTCSNYSKLHVYIYICEMYIYIYNIIHTCSAILCPKYVSYTMFRLQTTAAFIDSGQRMPSLGSHHH